jgi:molybdopterin-guanine dinucleotide biosynthesis protein A
MLGVVLCGGESKRMGSDKALLQKNATTWAELTFNTLSALNIPVVLSVNIHQLSFYSSIFPTHKMIVDDAALAIGGPLHGLLTVHQQYPSDDIILLACDMPTMHIEVVKKLVETLQLNPTREAIFFTNNHQPEPLCAIYTAKGLAKILALYNANKLPKHSMKYVLEQLATITLTMPTNWSAYFKNYNATSDLQHL